MMALRDVRAVVEEEESEQRRPRRVWFFTLSEAALYAICTSALKNEGSRIMKARRPKIRG